MVDFIYSRERAKERTNMSFDMSSCLVVIISEELKD